MKRMQISGQVRRNQDGMVSIMVALLLMVVITLLIIAFARIAWREQRQSLDRQLSIQAFYAAESGVNAAITAIQGGFTGSKDNCDQTAPFVDAYDVDVPNGVVVTCLLIDDSPDSLEYANVDVSNATVVRVDRVERQDGSAATANSLEFSWEDTTGDNNTNGCPNNVNGDAFMPFEDSSGVPQWHANCHAGVLRIDIVRVNGNFSRNNLESNVSTVFAYPSRSGGASYQFYPSEADFATPGNPNTTSGEIVEGRCDGTRTKKCYVRIHSINTDNFYLRMRSIYLDSKVTVRAYDNAGGSGDPLHLEGAQTQIDSTGRANDVLRRVMVRLPDSSSEATAPDFALVSAESICKRFTIIPGNAPSTNSGECTLL